MKEQWYYWKRFCLRPHYMRYKFVDNCIAHYEIWDKDSNKWDEIGLLKFRPGQGLDTFITEDECLLEIIK
jgi:hypothetical protein